MICGLGSQLIQSLYPGSTEATVGVSSALFLRRGPTRRQCANSLLELIGGLTSAATFWKRVSIGLGVLSGLLAIGLVVAMMYR